LRRKQGYTVAMAVEESRPLQVTIFLNAVQKHEYPAIASERIPRSLGAVELAVNALQEGA
jgi:hypothetical protein